MNKIKSLHFVLFSPATFDLINNMNKQCLEPILHVGRIRLLTLDHPIHCTCADRDHTYSNALGVKNGPKPFSLNNQYNDRNIRFKVFYGCIVITYAYWQRETHIAVSCFWKKNKHWVWDIGFWFCFQNSVELLWYCCLFLYFHVFVLSVTLGVRMDFPLYYSWIYSSII